MILYTKKHNIAFQIDEDDLEVVSRYSWFIHHKGYPSTNIGAPSNKRSISLHRLLLGSSPTGLWDHENRDKLDNRRHNLRPATRRLNGLNRDPLPSTTGIIGVSKCRDRAGWWRAYIRFEGQQFDLGRFRTLQEAADARKTAESKYRVNP